MLPIFEVIEPLKAALSAGPGAVLVAEPGAGKTTVAPLELLGEAWADRGRLILLEPRRIAARGAAARMAARLGESVGGTVGLRVRLQSLVSARTRIEVVTEGVFMRMILEDPALEGVSAVIFDEFHERSLDADLGLALARHTQDLFRPDLRLLVMSATLDGGRVSRLIGDAPVITSRGRAHPVETRYLGRRPDAGLEAEVERAVRIALASEEGGVLVFLPGQGEILRTLDRLAGRLPPDVILAPLYAALDFAAQDEAIRPAPPGRRKVVLATSIAETSLTLEGVRIVVDCGFSRVPHYEPAAGLTRLRTVRTSRAAADQRRGRAGRTAPGVCYRLWEEEETRALPAFAPPEILTSELSGFLLTLTAYGVRDPGELALLDPPPRGALAEAAQVLDRLGALLPDGGLSDTGRAMAALPLPPRLARLVLEGARSGRIRRAANMAAVLSERGLGGASADLSRRVDAFERARDPRAQDARRLAEGWAAAAARLGASEPGAGPGAPASDGALLLAAFPERLARRRGPGDYQLFSGRGAQLDPEGGDPEWLVAAELSGSAPSDRIRLAAGLDPEEALRALRPGARVHERLVPGSGGVLRVRRTLTSGAFVLEERVTEADPEALARALLEEVRAGGLDLLPWPSRAGTLRKRWAFVSALGETDLGDVSGEGLLQTLEDWLVPLLAGARRLADVDPGALVRVLEQVIGRRGLERLERLAPERFRTPVGSEVQIDYGAEGGPRAEVRVQELFGLGAHPMLAGGRCPLVLALTSPARRPIQVTRDLPGFWKGSWSDVRKEMRGRYPRHPWPEDPLNAAPTTRAKPRGVGG